MWLNVKITDKKKGVRMMKNLKYFGLAFLLAMSLDSCVENEMPLYDTNNTAMNIWFGNANLVLDSSAYNYSYAMGEKALTFIARITGMPVDRDRTFEIEAYEGDLEEAAGSFRTETYTLKANETTVECPIYFNTAQLKNPVSFTQRDGYLKFRLKNNDEFGNGTDEKSVLKVVLKNYLDIPNDWVNPIYPNMDYVNFFGTYSVRKYQFIISVWGYVDFHIDRVTTVDYDEATNTLSKKYAKYMYKKLQIALEEYNSNPNNPDVPLRDESGNVITFPDLNPYL